MDLFQKKPTQLKAEWENCYEKEIGVRHQLMQRYNKLML